MQSGIIAAFQKIKKPPRKILKIFCGGLLWLYQRQPPVKPNLIKISSSPERPAGTLGYIANA